MALLFTRRHLLQSALVMSGAMLVPRRASAAGAARLPGQLGLILPESAAGESFQGGLNLAVPGQRTAVARVGPGSAAAALGARRLLAGGSDQLIGLLDPNVTTAVAAELKQSRVTLLAVSTGANLIRADEESPQVITHSLGLWQGSVALGSWAVRQYGPRGLVLSGFLESGYDMLHAFEVGVTKAGGEALPAIVTHTPTHPVDWRAVLRQVRDVRPDVVYAQYSGTAAVEFLRAWRSSDLRVPLLASPFLVDESLLPHHGGRADGILSASGWAPGLSNPANERFVAGFTAAAGRAPDAFALLGYEAGLLAVHSGQTAYAPRGWIRPGPVGATRFSLYLRQVVGQVNQVVGALPAPAENDPAVAALRSAVRTGWITPYLV